MKKANQRHIIPASALGYAISFLLLVGLFTSGVLFITSTHKRIEAHFVGQEYLLFDNYTGIMFGASTESAGVYQLHHPSGDSSDIVVKNWGMLKSTVVSTRNKHRVVKREALTMQETDAIYPCLYMPDQKRKIALAGETRLEGKVYASERALTRANIYRKPLKADKLIYGKLYKSERYLPPLRADIAKSTLSTLLEDVTVMEELPKDSTFSFSEKSTLYRSNEGIEVTHRYQGNLILHSLQEILVRSSASLEHVILHAPRVIFEKGFKGKVQVLATEQILCEEEVQLDYPSALMLYEKRPGQDQSRVTLMKNARVLGGILLTSENPNFRKPVFLEVLDATVGGLIYNQGESEIRGEVIGSLYTNKLVAHAGGGVYGGHLVDAIISTKQLPENFIMPNWLKESKITKPVLITCI
ncbi:MAG: hypothetical protein NXI10_05625 [bacterium]|nr:hypothetical protein [bacterium]